MLRLDLPRSAGLRASMDQGTAELVAQLSVRLGMALDNAAPVALTLGTADQDNQRFAASYLRETLTRAEALLNALTALT
jgi:hypothetical protein